QLFGEFLERGLFQNQVSIASSRVILEGLQIQFELFFGIFLCSNT
ncbi:unnamed protein product, partial [Rotaria sp. Silwood2]